MKSHRLGRWMFTLCPDFYAILREKFFSFSPAQNRNSSPVGSVRQRHRPYRNGGETGWIRTPAETVALWPKRFRCLAQSVLYPPGWRGSLLLLPKHDKPRKKENLVSKMSEMAQTIEELRNAAAAITEAADWLTRQFSAPWKKLLRQSPSPKRNRPSRWKRCGPSWQTSLAPDTPLKCVRCWKSTARPSCPRSTLSIMRLS